jgi:beta-phosphoglucomutase
MTNNIYGLIFDVDGVIADTESLSSIVTAGVFTELFGIQGVTHDDFNAGRGRGAEAYLRAAALNHGVELTAEQVLRAEEARESRFLAHLADNPLPAYPGVLELISAAMAEPSLRVAIATSSTRTKSQEVLTSAGVPYDKMVYITGSDVSNKKPHPELFLTSAEKIVVLPDKCLVIEDAPSGIEAAINAGCRCLAVTNSFSADKLGQAHRVIDSLSSISVCDVLEMISQR